MLDWKHIIVGDALTLTSREPAYYRDLFFKVNKFLKQTFGDMKLTESILTPVGEVIRDLYLGRVPFVDVSPLSAGRFADDAPRPEANLV